MKLSCIEIAIYGSAYASAFERVHSRGVRDGQDLAEWERDCAYIAIDHAIGAVQLHRIARAALRRDGRHDLVVKTVW